MALKSWQKKTGLFVILPGFLIFGLGIWYFYTSLTKPLHFGDEILLIEPGDTLSVVAAKLIDRNVIDNPYVLKIHARITKIGSLIKAGEYQIPNGISLAEFLSYVVNGKGQIGIRITIIEGWSFKQMRGAINKAKKLNKTTANWSDQQIMAAMGFPDIHPEGQFYPDTYKFRSGDSDLSIYKKAFSLMQGKLDYAWKRRQNGLQVDSKYEALILASIIEKESQAREEQPEISGVFHNRLRKGMRLQTDPTVIYGIGDKYRGNITRKHLRADNPYNTYTRWGLPPTPISLPGNDSLMAAVNPKETKSLYFVARGQGRHKFSETLEEHNAAVQKYILSKK